MSDTTFALAAFGLAASAWASAYLAVALHARRGVAGVRIVTCPETQTLAAVTFDRGHAVVTALVSYEPELRLADCSRWSVRGVCDQPCVPQAQLPESRVAAIVARWSARQRCVFCGKRVIDAPRLGHHVALRAADGVTQAWTDLPAELVPDALRTRGAVCSNCQVVETFRREHPELVTDRPYR